MRKIIVFAGMVLFLGMTLCFAQQESLTITTYYPSPHGVYGTLRLYPSADNPSTKVCSNNEIGEMYFHDGTVKEAGIYYCNGSAWVKQGGGEFPPGVILEFEGNTCPAGWTYKGPSPAFPTNKGQVHFCEKSGGGGEYCVTSGCVKTN